MKSFLLLLLLAPLTAAAGTSSFSIVEREARSACNDYRSYASAQLKSLSYARYADSVAAGSGPSAGYYAYGSSASVAREAASAYSSAESSYEDYTEALSDFRAALASGQVSLSSAQQSTLSDILTTVENPRNILNSRNNSLLSGASGKDCTF